MLLNIPRSAIFRKLSHIFKSSGDISDANRSVYSVIRYRFGEKVQGNGKIRRIFLRTATKSKVYILKCTEMFVVLYFSFVFLLLSRRLNLAEPKGV